MIKIKIVKELSEKKGKKKVCGPSNPFHNEDGEFSSPEEATSWSVSDKGPQPCSWGQSKVSGKKRLFVKKSKSSGRCGRRDPKSDKVKEKELCKGGDAWEESLNRPVEVSDEEIYEKARRIQKLNIEIERLEAKIVKLRSQVDKEDGWSIKDALTFCSNLQDVDRGKFLEKD